MQKDVITFEKTFCKCQIISLKKKRMPIEKKPVTSIFESFSVDFSGPISKTKNGNRCTIASVEHLSRWLISKDTTSHTADIAVMFFGDKVRANFGSPETFLSFQGQAFTSIAW